MNINVRKQNKMKENLLITNLIISQFNQKDMSIQGASKK